MRAIFLSTCFLEVFLWSHPTPELTDCMLLSIRRVGAFMYTESDKQIVQPGITIDSLRPQQVGDSSGNWSSIKNMFALTLAENIWAALHLRRCFVSHLKCSQSSRSPANATVIALLFFGLAFAVNAWKLFRHKYSLLFHCNKFYTFPLYAPRPAHRRIFDAISKICIVLQTLCSLLNTFEFLQLAEE